MCTWSVHGVYVCCRAKLVDLDWMVRLDHLENLGKTVTMAKEDNKEEMAKVVNRDKR